MIPRASAKPGVIGSRYIRSEENIGQHTDKNEQVVGVPDTPKRAHTPSQKKFEISNSEKSDVAIMEVEWRKE